jgi:hypothetical protein
VTANPPFGEEEGTQKGESETCKEPRGHFEPDVKKEVKEVVEHKRFRGVQLGVFCKAVGEFGQAWIACTKDGKRSVGLGKGAQVRFGFVKGCDGANRAAAFE